MRDVCLESCEGATEDGPIRRKRKIADRVKLSTELDNTEEALAPDQLVKRFKHESKQLGLGASGSAGVSVPAAPVVAGSSSSNSKAVISLSPPPPRCQEPGTGWDMGVRRPRQALQGNA